jgi:hypothetical protein
MDGWDLTGGKNVWEGISSQLTTYMKLESIFPHSSRIKYDF